MYKEARSLRKRELPHDVRKRCRPSNSSPTSIIPAAKQRPALHISALVFVKMLQMLSVCRLAVLLVRCRCPPSLPAGTGRAPRTSREESVLLISLLRTLWPLSYQDMHDWLKSWPALALACGLPFHKEYIPTAHTSPRGWSTCA
jgi:hypothetical protein